MKAMKPYSIVVLFGYLPGLLREKGYLIREDPKKTPAKPLREERNGGLDSGSLFGVMNFVHFDGISTLSLTVYCLLKLRVCLPPLLTMVT